MTEKHANNNVRWPVITSQSFWVPIIDAIPEGNTEVGDSEEEEAHDNSEEAAQSRSTFKYKSSHPEELIIGSKDTPIRTSSAFRNESLIRLISQIEHTSIDEALTDDGWIVAMQE